MTDLPPLATFDQLAEKLGYVPEGGEADRANSYLVDASELIRDKAETTWLNDAVPRRVVRICLAAAYRAFNNPEALNQRTIGDSSKGYDRAGLDGGEAVYLTEEEERAVVKAAGASSFAAVTLVSPYSGDDSEVVS